MVLFGEYVVMSIVIVSVGVVNFMSVFFFLFLVGVVCLWVF